MRLNRVLQTKLNRVSLLTAGICMAMAAAIFTISCGEDGPDGPAGASCILSGTGVPYTVTCSGVEVGLYNGEPGEPGDRGPTGQKGQSCSLTQSGSNYTVTCGGDVQGTLGGCRIITNGPESIIDCGPTKVSLCNDELFDPSEYVCKADGTTTSTAFCGPESDGLIYNPTKKYCGFKDSASWVAGKLSVLDLCGEDSPNKAVAGATDDDPWVLVGNDGTDSDDELDAWEEEYCQVSRTGDTDIDGVELVGGVYVPKETKAAAKRSDNTCNGVDVVLNKDTWQGEYCGFATSSSSTKSVVKNACGNGDGPDEEAFGKTYCAITSASDYLTSASDKFCANVKLGKVIPASLAAANKLNANTSKDVLARDAWKGEYCGYTRADFIKTIKTFATDSTGATAPAAGTGGKVTAADSILYLSVIKGNAGKQCETASSITGGKNIGPNDSAAYDFRHTALTVSGTITWTAGAAPKWLNQFCQVAASGNPSSPAPTAMPKVGDVSVYCTLKPDTISSSVSVAAMRINEGSFKGQACVFANLAAYPTSAKPLGAPTVVANTACKDDSGVPNDASLSRYIGTVPGTPATTDYYGTITAANQSFWHNEFCQPDAADENKIKRVGIALAGTGKLRDANILKKYCTADTTFAAGADDAANTVNYVAKFQAAGANQYIDKDVAKATQYCGFLTKADLHTTIKFTRRTRCTDGTAPNLATDITQAMVTATIGNPTTAAELTTKGYFKNEYCQYNPETGLTTKVGISLANIAASGDPILRDKKILLKYCPQDTAIAAASDRGNAAYIEKFQNTNVSQLPRLNADAANNNQYCGFESKAKMETEATNPNVTTTEVAGSAGKVKRPNFKVSGTATATSRCSNPDGNFGPNQARDEGDDGREYTSWDNEYCQASKRTDGFTTRVGGAGNYCIPDEATFDYTDASKANGLRLNEGSWKGQYCFDADQKIGICTGGWVPMADAKSTDVVRCELP
ncbi:MAG: hypothetical protein LBC64_05460 [Fibromonadaceae bacterium]|nr:hypothetical protein [Fibromonadaceae bacterium]